MGFTFEDFLHSSAPKLGINETFRCEMASLESWSAEQIRESFPDVKLTKSDGIAYVPLTMCHSLPNINKRKRCFTVATLENSFASAVHSLVDIDHMIEDNEVGLGEDRIIGTIAGVRFDARMHALLSTGKQDGKALEIADAAKMIPDKPVPLYAMAALFLRAKGVPQILQNHERGKQVWKTSMECGHDWKDAALYYRGEFIPLADAPGPMREGIRANTILPYKDHEVAVALGGVNGKVDFWGLALTTSAADDETKLLGMVSGLSRDLASKKIFHMPIRSYSSAGEKSLELANEAVDKKITELASISVIGETAEADGHTHLILSDLTILPNHGHHHCSAVVNISRGTKPTLTGRTDVHYMRTCCGDEYSPHHTSESVPHLHMIELPLNGRYQLSSGKSAESEVEGSTGSELSSLNELNEGEDSMKLQAILDRLNDLSKQVANLPQSAGTQQNDAVTKLASAFQQLTTDLNSLNSQEVMQTAVSEEIDRRIKAGALLTKEQADAAVVAKEAEITTAHAAEAAALALRQSRIDKVREAGLKLEYELPGRTNKEGKPLTIAQVLEGLTTDDAGTTQFESYLHAWKMVADAEKQANQTVQTAAQVAAQTQAPAANTTLTEAASKKQSILATVGGEVASAAQTKAQPAASATPSVFQGKNAIKSV